MVAQTRVLMGMPVTVEICDAAATKHDVDRIFDYFSYIDETFSTYKPHSEISKINQGLIAESKYSPDMRTVLLLCDKTNQETGGYFDIKTNQGKLDPSGLVKGWAINQAAQLLKKSGFVDFYVEAGGDIQVSGKNPDNQAWTIGIKNPFNTQEIVKVLALNHNEGVATSGSYERGSHIYNPKQRSLQLAEIVSLTVIGPDIYEADRFATAAFAMQKEGIGFIENLPGFEGYAIDRHGTATMTSHFQAYVKTD